MIIIIPSAKTFCEIRKNHSKNEQLLFCKEKNELLTHVQELSIEEIEKIMKVSHDLAFKTFSQYHSFENQEAFSAIEGFYGAMYKAMDVSTFNDSEQAHIQGILRILSGLYGMLKPYDLIREYRLEMATPLVNTSGKNLYAFWRDRLTNELINQLALSPGEKVLINLSSGEYSKAIQLAKVKKQFPIIEIVFKEKKGESYKLIGTYAKVARGLMINYIAKNKILTVAGLKDFNSAGYAWNEELSTESQLVFTREGVLDEFR